MPSGTATRPPRGPKRALALGLVAVGAGLFVFKFLSDLYAATGVDDQGACMAMDPQVIEAAGPEFELPDLKGKKQRLADFKGQVVLLNFWATWCPPCIEELPSLLRLRNTIGSPNFRLVTVSVDDSADVVRTFFNKQGKDYDDFPVLLDPTKKVSGSYGTLKFPETYLIDRAGVVRYRFINKREWSSATSLACIRSVISRP